MADTPIVLPLRCEACDQIVGSASLRWDGSEAADLVATADTHEDRHLPDCTIGYKLRHGVTAGVSIDLDAPGA